MEYKYKVKETGFSGYVVLNILSYPERMALIKQVNLGLKPEGLDTQIDDVEKSLVMLNKASEFVKSVEVVGPNGELLNSWDDLTFFASEICNEITQVVFAGVKLTKN